MYVPIIVGFVFVFFIVGMFIEAKNSPDADKNGNVIKKENKND